MSFNCWQKQLTDGKMHVLMRLTRDCNMLHCWRVDNLQPRAEDDSSGRWGEVFYNDVASHTGLHLSQLLHLTYNNPCPPSHSLHVSHIHSPSFFPSISHCRFPPSSSFFFTSPLINFHPAFFRLLPTSPFICPSLHFYPLLFSCCSFSLHFLSITPDWTLCLMSPLGDKPSFLPL